MPPQTPTKTQPPSKPAEKGSKMSNFEWGLIIGVAATCDLFQAILNFFLVGVAINRFLNIFIGGAFALYFKIRGVKMDTKNIITLIGGFVLESIPGLDFLPVWTAYTVRAYFWDKASKKLSNLPI